MWIVSSRGGFHYSNLSIHLLKSLPSISLFLSPPSSKTYSQDSNLSPLTASCQRLHVRWTNAPCRCKTGGVLYKVTLLTVHHFCTGSMLCFHFIAIFVHVQSIFLLFCWSSTKQCVTILVSQSSCLKNEPPAGVRRTLCQGKAEFTFRVHSSRMCVRIKETTDDKQSAFNHFRCNTTRFDIELMWCDWTYLGSVICACN